MQCDLLDSSQCLLPPIFSDDFFRRTVFAHKSLQMCKYCIKTRLTTRADFWWIIFISFFNNDRNYTVTWLEVDEAEVHEQNNESCVGLKSCIDFLPWENLHKNVVVLTSLLLLGDHLQVIKLCKNQQIARRNSSSLDIKRGNHKMSQQRLTDFGRIML